jgi:MFS transporter, PPP family, 3-phenylpropionic acid transporter
MGSPVTRFLALFSSLYLGFGIASPFFPVFLASKGFASEQIRIVLSLSGAVRLISGPLVGRLADQTQHVRAALPAVLLFAGALAFSFSTSSSFSIVFCLSVVYAAALVPTTTLADALALRSSQATPISSGFEYGWVRGSGSAAFVLGSLVSGQLLGVFASVSALLAQAICLVVAASVALAVPEICSASEQRVDRLYMPGLACWGVLSPLSAMALVAVTAVIRWGALGQTFSIVILACVEPLHGITFALLHLACMRILVMVTPSTLAATAQSIYAFGIGLCSVALTYCSGLLYERVGNGGFFVMAAVAAAAMPVVWLLARAIGSTPFRGNLHAP